MMNNFFRSLCVGFLFGSAVAGAHGLRLVVIAACGAVLFVDTILGRKS